MSSFIRFAGIPSSGNALRGLFRSRSIQILCGVVVGAQTQKTLAQGCVAVRGCSNPLALQSSTRPDDADLAGGDWLASVGYRWLHSHRHFVGDAEQTYRQADGTQIINQSHFIDLGVQYAVTPRYSVSFTLPVVTSERSQRILTKPEFPGPTFNSAFFYSAQNVRYHTEATGIGDIRLGGYAWLWSPTTHAKGNIQLGISLKAPTGDSGLSGTFYTTNSSVVKTLDQSIQPGDGGWGFALEANAYRELFARTTVFAQASYLFNPQNENGVLTWRDNATSIPGVVTATPKQAAYYEHYMSVPDQYFGRAGVAYTVVPKWGLSVTAAGRIEGIPVEDVIGGSDGFRRPGFAISFEPGIVWMKGRYSANLTVPFALYRNRERSVADQKASGASGTNVHGDAAFADYVVTAAFSLRF